MMREIKFRGMDLQGRWFIGNYAKVTAKGSRPSPGSYISNSAGMPFAYQIRPETVGQFTGLKDKNGVEIYEGDVLRNTYKADRVVKRTKCGEYRLFCGKSHSHFKKGWSAKVEWEVIGNIYQDSHLLDNTEAV